MNGLFDGFMWGGITAGVSNVIKPGSFCFIAGTKVLTDSGQKNIEDIEVGDCSGTRRKSGIISKPQMKKSSARENIRSM